MTAFSRQQIAVLFVCVAIFALGQFHRASGGVFTPILMSQYALPSATVGSLVAVMFMATIIAQVPFGIALDAKGPRLMLGVCIVIISLGTLLFAVATQFTALVAARNLIGIGLAAMGAATHVIIARNFAGRDFGYISGLVVTLGGIGGLLGTYPLAFALSRAPWAMVFIGVAVVTLILSLIVFRVVRPGTAQNEETGPSGGNFRTLLGQAEFLRILVLGIVTFAPITAITGLWGGPYLQDVMGLTGDGAGAILLLFFCATIAAGLVFGVIDRKTTARKRAILIAAGLSSTCLLILAVLPSPRPIIAIGLLTVMVFSQQFYIPLGAHMKRTVPVQLLGRASTLLSLVSVAAIPALQLGFGAILDFGADLGFDADAQYRIAFAVMGGVILLCCGIYAFSKDVDDEAPTVPAD